MKVSICIPVYNFDVRELVGDLKNEISDKGLNTEIILIDDASEPEYKRINQQIEGEAEQFVFLEKNIGRSRIRNLFLTYSNGDYLLFLDCDGKITNTQFLTRYIEFIEANPEAKVVYGGRTVSEQAPDKKHYLRWRFANERENLSVAERLENPYLSFQTNNFIIKKEILEKIHFNPEFRNYGYEDLLFAMDLKSGNVQVHHIHNPIFNNDLEQNEAYLKKVDESVASLAMMLRNDSLAPKISEIRLVKAYSALKKLPFFKWNFNFFFSIGKNGLKSKILKGGSLRYLDLYKLGLLLQKMKQ